MDVRVEPDARRGSPGRRVGREPLLDAGADLLAEVDLADVAGAAVGVRAVAEAAGVSPATVNHHFRPDGGGRNRRLAAAAVTHAMDRWTHAGPTAIAEAAIAAVGAVQAGEPDALDRLAAVAADDVLWWTPDDDEPHRERDSFNAALYLAIAAARCSGDARSALRRHYAEVTDIYADLYGTLLEATGRRPVEGLDVRDFTIVLSALADGFILRRRFEREAAPAPLFGSVAVRIFEALSTPVGAAEDHHPDDVLVPLPPGSQLDGHKRAAIARAATAVYMREGWEGISIAAVARESGAHRRTVIANFGDRAGLAAAVWAQFVPGLRTGLADDAALPVHRRVLRHLERLAAVAAGHRHLTGAMMEGVLRAEARGLARGTEPDDPRAMVPLTSALAPVLEEGRAAFRPGQVDDAAQAGDGAALLTSTTLQLVLRDRTAAPSAVSARVCDTVLAGMLRRRPARW